jgi:hypothetical protein
MADAKGEAEGYGDSASVPLLMLAFFHKRFAEPKFLACAGSGLRLMAVSSPVVLPVWDDAPIALRR